MWKWLGKFGKGAVKVAPSILDTAADFTPVGASVGLHAGAKVLRKIQHQDDQDDQVEEKELQVEPKQDTLKEPVAVNAPITVAKIAGAVDRVVSQTVASQAVTKVQTTITTPIPGAIPTTSSIDERIHAMERYVKLLERALELENQLRR